MSRLIDADALPRHGKRKGLIKAADVDKAPTVEAVPVVHGYWREAHMSERTGYNPALSSYYDPVYGHVCSLCGGDAIINDCGDELLTKYCPNCGAKMDGEE